MIDFFMGEYFFLSNFYEAPVTYDGLTYESSEAAFQAQKAADKGDRIAFTTVTPSESKKMGRRIPLRRDWEEVKDQIMYEICLSKFIQNPELKQKLLATGYEGLVEGNTWNDRYWGVCDGVGQNMLGKILMRVRAELGVN